MTKRHKELQRRLLTQNRLGVNAPGIAKQRGQQCGGVGHASLL